MVRSGLLLVLLSQVFMEALTDVAPDCSRNFTDPQGVITTPNFPENYPNNIACTFMILAPQTSEIMLEFTSFEMEYSFRAPDTCSRDSLEIWDGFPGVGSRIGKFCGLGVPDPVVSRSSVLSMIFITNDRFTRKGFSANYIIRERRPSPLDQYACGGLVDFFPGYIRTDGYPIEYPSSQRCLWAISAPRPTQKIVLNFNPRFELGDKQCENDYLEIYDGGYEDSPLLGRFCGTVAPSQLMSNGSKILIKIVTDDENSHQAGFSVRYNTYEKDPDCSRNFTDPQGVITSPKFPKNYPKNINCTIMILAPETSEIMLEFTSFAIERFYMDPECEYDSLEIWDGFPEVGSRVGRYCGWTYPEPVVSNSSVLTMLFVSDDKLTEKGFSAKYTIRDRTSD